MDIKEPKKAIATLLAAIPVAVGLKDSQGRWLLANPQALRLLRLEGEHYRGKTDAELAKLVPELEDVFAYCHTTDEYAWLYADMCRYDEIIANQDGQNILYEIIKVPLFKNDGSRQGIIFLGRDVTKERSTQTEIDRLTYYDWLTGLPNRFLLTERLRQTIVQHHTGVIVLIDLDHFKIIHESLGFEASNKVIKEVARRLEHALRPQDTISRLGGDEFCIIIPGTASAEDAGDAATRIINAFKRPFHADRGNIVITASLGLTLAPRDGLDPDTILKNAELAMYRAKERGGNTFAFYTTDLETRVSEYLLLETHLRKAIHNGELNLHYQPQISLDTGGIIGCEALARWNSNKLGAISPAKFIPVAERSGLIIPLGEKVLKDAIERLKTWHHTGFEHIYVSVNLSAKQFQDPNLLAKVNHHLAHADLSPKHLELEVTESTAMLDIQQSVKILSEIKKMGVSIAMDDFGIEYSSLNHIKHLPIDTIKIDQSFIRGGLQNPVNRSIVGAVIEIARSLGLRVIAEGVETEEQLRCLQDMKCYGIQGYIFSKPLPPDDFLSILVENRKIN